MIGYLFKRSRATIGSSWHVSGMYSDKRAGRCKLNTVTWLQRKHHADIGFSESSDLLIRHRLFKSTGPGVAGDDRQFVTPTALADVTRMTNGWYHL